MQGEEGERRRWGEEGNGMERGIFTSLRFHFVYWLLKNDGAEEERGEERKVATY